MEIKKMNLKDLQPAEYNPRENLQPGDEEYEKIKNSLKAFGYVEPIVWNEQSETVVGGHQRLKVMIDLGYKEADVSIVNLDEQEEKALNIALNKIEGAWDFEKLYEVLDELGQDTFDLTGFDLEEFEELTNMILDESELEDPEEDEFDPEEEVEPITQPGDVWQLGKHRLLCGDATKEEDVEKLMQGEKATMTFTDPPYLMNFSGSPDEHGGMDTANAKHRAMLNDDLSKKDGDQFINDFTRTIKNYTQGAWYICFYRLGIDRLFDAVRRSGMKWRNLIIWKKNNFTLSNSDYKSMYEPIITGYADDYVPIMYGWNFEHDFYGHKGDTDIWEIEIPSVWEVDRTKENDLHPTMKPIELCGKAIKNSSRINDLVLDLFGGSGSTLIASEQLERRCNMMEMTPIYCDVIIKRWEEYTGQEAELLTREEE